MIVIAYAAGAALVIGSLLAGAGGRSTFLTIVVAAAGVAAAGVALSAWRRSLLRTALVAIRDARSVVATGMIEAPVQDVAKLIGELGKLGFELQGATDTTIGDGSPVRTWVLTDTRGPATSWIEVGFARGPMAIVLSRAADGRFLETSYPDGEEIDHPNLLARPAPLSAADAVQAHRAVLAEWETRSGPALAVRTMDEYRIVEDELRERTAGMRIAAYLERVVEPGLRNWAICAAIGLATFVAIFVIAPPVA